MKILYSPFTSSTIRNSYEDALEKLVREDFIEKEKHSEWASPTASIVGMGICGDHSVIINKFSVLKQYPVPPLEVLLTKLPGGKRFPKN